MRASSRRSSPSCAARTRSTSLGARMRSRRRGRCAHLGRRRQMAHQAVGGVVLDTAHGDHLDGRKQRARGIIDEPVILVPLSVAVVVVRSLGALSGVRAVREQCQRPQQRFRRCANKKKEKAKKLKEDEAAMKELENQDLNQTINTLAMASPFSLEEKQALLETQNLVSRKFKLEEIIKTYVSDDFSNTTLQ